MQEKESELSAEHLKRKYLEDYLIENYKYLYSIALNYVKNRDDALEIVQNTIYKSLVSIKSLKDVKSMRAWVSRILINNCFDFLKSSNKVMLSECIFDQTNDYNKNILDKIVLKKAIDKLPSKLRLIVILRFFVDFKIKDISHILNMKENTVKTNLYKALGMLKINLGEDI